MSGHFRLHPRYPLKVRVTIRRASELSSLELEGTTENLGMGGAFIRAGVSMPVGSDILVFVNSATTWEPLKLLGRVRWIRENRSQLHAGMGIMFVQLTTEQVIALHRLFGAHGFEDE